MLGGQRAPDLGTSSRTRSEKLQVLVQRANDIPIQKVLSDIFGLWVPDVTERSFKVDCPFNFEHPDGGLDKNCRVYGTSHLYCFAMHGGLTPVRLMQIKHDIRAGQAALKLLEHYDMVRPKPWRERRDELILARETKASGLGSSVDLVEALHLTVQKHPGYADAQFGETFSASLEEQLLLLDRVLVTPGANESNVREWYDGARRTLTSVLDDEGASRGR